jgi:hypothetical protein
MAEELGADLVSIGQAQPETLTAFEAKLRTHLVEGINIELRFRR